MTRGHGDAETRGGKIGRRFPGSPRLSVSASSSPLRGLPSGLSLRVEDRVSVVSHGFFGPGIGHGATRPRPVGSERVGSPARWLARGAVL